MTEDDARGVPYRPALDALGTPIAIVHAGRDAAGGVVDVAVAYANPAMTALLAGGGHRVDEQQVDDQRSVAGIHLLRAALAGERVLIPGPTGTGSPGARTWRLDVVPLADDEPAVPRMIVARDVGDEVRDRWERDRILWELEQAQRVARTGSWWWDARGGESWGSEELSRVVDLPPEILHARDPESGLVALAERSAGAAEVLAAWRKALVDRQPFELALRQSRPDGGLRHVVMRAEVVVGEDGEVTGIRGTTQDVTDTHLARQALAESEERFRLAFEESPIGKALLSPGLAGPDAGRLLRVNRALSRLLGRPADELVGTALLEWVHPDDREAAEARLAAATSGPDAGPEARVEVRLAGEPDRQVWAALGATAVRDAEGRPLYLLVRAEDVTARRTAESELVRHARFDALTGLPNRASLLEHLEGLLVGGARVAVFFLDLDDFKTVNDSLGHAAGDELLERVATQIEGCVPDAFAARWGGDEFVLVSPRHARPGAVRSLADRIRDAVSQPVRVDDHEVTATVSIGIALGDEGSTAEGLLRDADIAMYRAKAAGKDRWALADQAGHAGALRRLTLASALRRALEDDQLCLRYQPVVDLADGRVVSVEALLRWRHPQRGLLEPAEFLDVAESSTLIVPVGEWALRTAARQAMEWYRRFGAAAPTVAVNVSARQLGHARLRDRVAAALAETGLPPERLCVELTEREALATSGSGAADLQAVHQAGVLLAVDDFGTGYTGLDYLRRFPVDILKVDQSFVSGLGTDPTATAIVVSLITLGRALDVTVVAEGVEDDAQRVMLRRLQCPQGQGLLWSPPVSADRIAALLPTHPSP